MKKTSTAFSIGIDGCKDGWIVVSCPVFAFSEARARHYESLVELKNDFTKSSICIIDMPIGIEHNKPNRSCDTAARKFLANRSSTIFSPPCHDALFSQTYEEANAINKQKTGKGISKQSWFLSKKIIETQNFMRYKKGLNLKEGHPECSFAEYLGEPILDNKKGMRGIFKRLEILTNLNFQVTKLVEMLPKKAKIGIDDLLDAAILCWTASRFMSGDIKTLPSLEENNNSFSSDFFIYV